MLAAPAIAGSAIHKTMAFVAPKLVRAVPGTRRCWPATRVPSLGTSQVRSSLDVPLD